MNGVHEEETSFNRKFASNEIERFIQECEIFKSRDYLEFFDLVLSFNEKHLNLSNLVSF